MESEKTLHAQFIAQKNKTPHAIALRSDKSLLTYQELDRHSTALASYLLEQGVVPGDKIGVYLYKGSTLVISLLGILKAGACYVPLDPSYPRDRLLYMVRHADARVIITETALAANLEENERRLMDISALDLDAPYAPDLPQVDDNALCYVMYTSGSTGQPKGVMVRHRTVVNYLLWMQDAFALTPQDVVLNQSTFSFDVSVWEIFWPLIIGASCALIADDMKYDPALLADFMQQHQVTVAQFVPTALRVIAAAQVLPSCPRLQHLFSGGEALDQQLVNDLSAQFSGHIHNLYGPTEATIFICHWLCQPGADLTIVPIGTPIPHARAYVLDEHRQPLPPGEAGELYLAGDTLALGYLNAPEQTQASFVPDPFVSDSADRMYKTGDIVRARMDGVLEFIGRVDSQVKLRGHRVELNEIEATLRTFSKLANVVVALETAQDTQSQTLNAFYVLRENETTHNQELKAHLSKYLPFYMVPSHFIELKKIPTLPNGKVDNAHLRHYLKKGGGNMSEKTTALGNGIETEIIKIWKQVLENQKLSVHENFFDAGGNSLLMSKVHREIKKHLGIPISIMELFQYPTVKTLSSHISKKHASIAASLKTAKQGRE
ncbi:non-ribosomal peptide synthetase [Prodigiosinella aquatilis]|nr:non-ribosomal peptide synthetase [Prodigiosinella sp. LS101]WJV55293.1 non-ribosomal peptide synthetase [Prodigiosinella sp. LS101]WJV59654.1 non-ribosomal peptide synthetase [Pectobacteriaceae bacterium C111]